MLINFVNEDLTKTIVCDKPSCDSNDVTNLISLDPVKRGKGFLVERFVKPPVLINIEFICNVTINKITVNCQVGAQKSSCIEVSTKQKGCNRRVVVARKQLNEHESIVNFVLHGSQRKIPNSETFRLSKYMCSVNEVAFRILQTQGSTLVAIGKIEVWGKPSKNVSKETFKLVTDIWHKIISCPTKVPKETKSQQPEKTIFRYCRERESQIQEVDIPEEFIDPISCEILITPMTLPSGKVIDASTIERFNKMEENFGRPPSDPFTGRRYTDISFPVVATALKARLDKFLLNYSHIPSLKSVPRTVGRAHQTEPSCSFVNYQPQDGSSQKNVKNIDDFLEHCLSGLPSFLEKPIIKKFKYECCKCNCQSLLFKLTCNDLICRHCLVSFKSDNISSCLNCNVPIDFKKVERFHTA
ncbi:RING finger protein 37 [Rhodnius prolixus]|uniref:Putative ring finger protein 37 n=1 Tax=Rhodnius prolixus TaxID=13249 RepID=A0A4P6D6E4_RHOPR